MLFMFKTSDLSEILSLLYFGFEPEKIERDLRDSRRVWFSFKETPKTGEIVKLVNQDKLKVSVQRFLATEKIFRQHIKNLT